MRRGQPDCRVRSDRAGAVATAVGVDRSRQRPSRPFAASSAGGLPVCLQNRWPHTGEVIILATLLMHLERRRAVAVLDQTHTEAAFLPADRDPAPLGLGPSSIR